MEAIRGYYGKFIQLILPNNTCRTTDSMRLTNFFLEITGLNYLNGERSLIYKFYTILYVFYIVFISVAAANGFFHATSIDLKVSAISALPCTLAVRKY